MSEVSIGEQIQSLLPKSLDDIIRRNREHASLRLSFPDDLDAATVTIPSTPYIKGELGDWRFITLDVPAERLILFALGNKGETSWMTSAVIGVDLSRKLVLTKSGAIYRLVGEPGKGEPSIHHLLRVCATFHTWGLGHRFGCPEVFF